MAKAKTRKITLQDIDQIEEAVNAGKTVEIEWMEGVYHKWKSGFVSFVRWDGLIFTDNDCIFPGMDRLGWIDIR